MSQNIIRFEFAFGLQARVFLEGLGALIICAAIGLLALSTPATAQGTESDEMKLWNYATGVNTLESFTLFADNYPESELAQEANDRIIELSKTSTALTLEENIFAIIGPVRWGDNLRFGENGIMGKTIEQVLNSTPAYPPVEGLPREYWATGTCANCHSWTRETICTQANLYVKQEPDRYHNKPHPFGGTFKINLRNWAQGDCP